MIRHFCIALIVGMTLLLGACSLGHRGNGQALSPSGDLELVQAWLLDIPRPLEPSGLTRYQGQLYTVADKDDQTIYRVRFEGEAASLVPAIRFKRPGRGNMDWEGITNDPEGNFYLVSEEQGRLCRVTSAGQADWASPDLRSLVGESGLFGKNNAGLEGIVRLGPDHWLGAVEREPRGLVEWKGNGPEPEIQAWSMLHSPFAHELPLIRLPDFSALAADGDRVYALFRNAHLVVRLEKDGETMKETEAWSYRHIETDPRWAYRNQVYGQAEGLVVDGEDVFIIFDNNLGGRQADPGDGRPLLVHVRFPSEN